MFMYLKLGHMSTKIFNDWTDGFTINRLLKCASTRKEKVVVSTLLYSTFQTQSNVASMSGVSVTLSPSSWEDK